MCTALAQCIGEHLNIIKKPITGLQETLTESVV